MGETEYDGYPTQHAGERSNQSIIIDMGKGVAVMLVCAVICGACIAIAWNAVNEQNRIAFQYHDDAKTLQDEYQKERNHVIILEAMQEAQAKEIAALKQSK